MSIDILMIQAFVAMGISVDFMKTSLDPFMKPCKNKKRHLNPHKDPVTVQIHSTCILGVSFYTQDPLHLFKKHPARST